MKVARTILALGATLALAVQPAAAQSYADAPRPGMGAFGGAVAVAGHQVLVGEPNNQLRPGTVYIYEQSGDGAWKEVGQFTAPNGEPGDGFGASLAVEDDRLLVGANGAVYGLTRSDGAWTHVGSMTAASATEEDGFGAAVALSGDWALVGGPGRAERSGAAWAFRRGAGGWSQVAMLEPEQPQSNTFFGAAVGLRDDLAFVGVAGLESRTGAVAVYRLSASGAERVATLTGEGVGRGERFGTALAVQRDRLVVGAPGVSNGVGAVFLFEPGDDGAWTQTGRLLPFDGEPRQGFGFSVAVNGSSTWVGAPNAEGGMGAAYLFWGDERRSGSVRVTPEEGNSFAGALGAAGKVAVFGMPNADFGAGRAAIFTEEEGGEWAQTGGIMSALEEYEAVMGSEIPCADGSASAFDCSEVDLAAFVPTSQMGGSRGVSTNDVWGWTDPQTGKEYALVGMMDATSIVDVSDPNNPVYVGKLPMTPGSQANAWRDMKVHANHMFVVADGAGQHGMQVFDLTRVRDFDGTPEVWEPDALYTGIASAHNIVINEDTGMAFAVGARMGGETCGGGLHMIDIGDPKNPTFAGCFADPQTGRASTGYSHDAQCVTYRGPDQQYQGREICLGSNETALSIADVTDRDNPVAISRAAYPNVGYSHQGWLTEDHRYFYMDDELDELQGKVQGTRTLIWDVSDLEDPQLVGEFFGTTEASDHNLYIVGDRVYQSNYQAGLRILDISDRENPVEVGYFDTVPHGTNTPGFGGSWSNFPFFESGIVIVTSGDEGLFILKPRDTRTIS